ncbi:MAG: ferrous iron transporter B [Cellulosilyticaceae bacterium]
MKIALAGNPNSGKTTLFNAITGKTEYVGNWPGVTVEKKEAIIKKSYRKNVGENIRIVDLPGAYSIAPYTSEEAIAKDFIIDEAPDVIVNIIDASSLERSLYFTTQLLEFDIPVVVALNKTDIIEKRGNVIDIDALANRLQCKVVLTVANQDKGLHNLIREVVKQKSNTTQNAPEFENKSTEDEPKARQMYVKQIVKECLVRKNKENHIRMSDKIDRFVAHPIFGIGIFAVIMWAVYAFSINGLGGFMSDYLNETFFGEIVPETMTAFLQNLGVNPLLESLIVDGMIAGVGAVIGFLPLIMLLFFMLALLEDSGYMARVAVVMDKYLKKIGLSGKSIIPMIVGTGCSIPGVMATRTIEDDNERKITTILTPFIPCGAKLPVIALFAAVFFPDNLWVFPSMYIIAGVMVVVGGLFLQKIFKSKQQSMFIIELPEYKLPNLKYAIKQMFKQAKGFIVKASTIILVMNSLIWFMQTYTWGLQVVEDPSLSILASLGGFVVPILIPVGVVGWQMAAATLTGFVAKENIVATLAIVLVVASEEALAVPGGAMSEFFNPVTGMAFLVFNLFAPPCFAAIGAMRAELGGWKWLSKALLFQFGTGYMLAMLVTQIGTIVVYGHTAPGFIASVIITVGVVSGLVVFFIKNKTNKIID